MFSLSNIIRWYIMLSIVVLISFFVMLTSIDVMLTPHWETFLADSQNLYHNLYVTVIVMTLITVVSGALVLIFILNRGLYKYQDFIRRFESINRAQTFNSGVLQFPEKDEFGNLGAYLNSFLAKIEHADTVKTKMLLLEKDKFEYVAAASIHPILLVDTKGYEPYISYNNEAFRDFFLKKSMYIDNNGRTNLQYHKIQDLPVVNLRIHNEEKEPFLNSVQLTQLKNNTILWEKNHIISNVIFKELSGKRQYRFTKVLSVPINNDYEGIMTQMLYIFMDPHEVTEMIAPKE